MGEQANIRDGRWAGRAGIFTGRNDVKVKAMTVSALTISPGRASPTSERVTRALSGTSTHAHRASVRPIRAGEAGWWR